jgi:hypothetical protein
VALLNLLGRLSDSVEYIRALRERVHAAEDHTMAAAEAPVVELAAMPMSAGAVLAGLAAVILAVLWQTRRCAAAPGGHRTKD